MHVPINMKRPIQVPSGVTEAVSGKITKIDRMDHHGWFREHLTRDGQRTLCGQSLLNCHTQPAYDTRGCRRCEKIAMHCQIQTPLASSEQTP